ncbi:MAG: nitroreductase [Chloroflexi bacterium HGW-Chloroflexi-5]|jgi:nitroreductase|nr:MAG: nitroreductase [Chloroflexi bacterium HGW-Chloroflexi-5]
MLKDLVLRNRSYRRFNPSKRISPAALRELVDLARLTPSGRNMQPLKYLLVTSEEACARLYPQLTWAGYLKDWDGPVENERPAAYVIMLGDTALAPNFGIDPGIAAQTLLLGAVEKGLGGCIFGTIKRDEIRTLFEISAQFEVLYVIALGEPVEKVVIDEVKSDGDIKYWRDAEQVHHLPKRALADLIVDEI